MAAPPSSSVDLDKERLTASMAFTNDDHSSVVINIRRRLPDFLNSVKLKYVKLGYNNSLFKLIPTSGFILFPLFFLVAAVLTGLILQPANQVSIPVDNLWSVFHSTTNLAALVLLFLILGLYRATRPSPVYLVDFAAHKPSDSHKNSVDSFLKLTVDCGHFNDDTIQFHRKIADRACLGDETYLPPGITSYPPRLTMKEARLEAESVIFSTIDKLIEKTGIHPSQIDILIVNCSLFNPTPSLSSMIVNRYKLKPSIKSFNLGGMGCSAGLISIDLAKHLLKANPNSYALVFSTENITLNWYFGNDKSMLLCNCIFRMGGAAVLLSNKSSDRGRSKYVLNHTVRTHKGQDDSSYNCVFQREDDHGTVGVSLARELMSVAGDALKTNITTLGPMVLPISEQVKFFISLLRRKLGHTKVKPYIPDFKKAFEHFCIHAGGRAVLDEVERNLKLGEWEMEPSRMTLHRFGNTSSSSLWYELAYSEAKGRVKRGDRVWQIAFGSGFKCNSAVWKALKNVEAGDVMNPWADCVDRYPVKLGK